MAETEAPIVWSEPTEDGPHPLSPQAVRKLSNANATTVETLNKEAALNDPPQDGSAKTATLKYVLMIAAGHAFSPFLFNTIWLMTANLVNCAGGMLQSFWYYALWFDLYFIFIKGTMVSAYFYVFMPTPTPIRGWMTMANHAFFAFAACLVNTLIHVLWWALDVLHEEGLTWNLLKLNFPITASLGLVVWCPLYLFTNYTRDRWFAFKRYLILVIVLVGDLFFISTSLVYTFFFFKFQRNELGWHPESWIAERGCEVAWIVGFSIFYMALLGKIWQFAIWLCNKFAPMDDLQHQRFLYFATVILDMHRIMYSRQIFMGLHGYLIFCLALGKGFLHNMVHFAIKSTPTYQAGTMITFLTKGEGKKGKKHQIFENIWVDRFVKALTTFDWVVGIPNRMLAVFHWDIDAGYRNFTDQKKTKLRYFCCDTMMHLKNLPSTYSNGLEESDSQQKWWATDEQNNTFDQQQIDELMVSEGGTKHSGAIAVCQPWRVKFYEQICVRLNGIIFTRYLTRIIIKFASSLCYLITGFLIRKTPSSKILNMVMDHSGDMATKLWFFGFVFLCLDCVEAAIVMNIQMSNTRRRKYNFRRFARFFDTKKAFLVMITLCHICCNSDVYLTFSNLKFCDAPLS